MAAKFFTGLPLEGPDPECVFGNGASALERAPVRFVPHPGRGHSRRRVAERPKPIAVRAAGSR
jgi:hypothetical protein